MRSGSWSFFASVFVPRCLIAVCWAVSQVVFNVPTPNPTRSEVAFSVHLARGEAVQIEIFDVSGKRVATLGPGSRDRGRIDATRIETPTPGWHSFPWDLRDSRGRSVPAGVYFARLAVGNTSHTRTLVVAR